MTRRARTKRLIELGSLAAKAGLFDLAGDDRALLYGAFLDLAQQLRGDHDGPPRQRWRRLGAHAFADGPEPADSADISTMREDGTGAG